MQATVIEHDDLQEGLPIVIHYDQSRLRYAAIQHTVDRPFCYDPTCPCNEPYGPLWMEYLHIPFDEGLLTEAEAQALIDCKNI